jgi:hypothetical protein
MGEARCILDRRQEVAMLSGVRNREGIRAAQVLVDRGIAEWRGKKPKIKAL